MIQVSQESKKEPGKLWYRFYLKKYVIYKTTVPKVIEDKAQTKSGGLVL